MGMGVVEARRCWGQEQGEQIKVAREEAFVFVIRSLAPWALALDRGMSVKFSVAIPPPPGVESGGKDKCVRGEWTGMVIDVK